jgi:succinoglycan biosynthesis transport protein ExoP
VRLVGVAPERPRAPGLDDRLVSLLPSRAAEVEPYLTVRHVLEEAPRLAGVSVVAVSSPLAGDGKTTTAINVAGVLGHGGDRVLLIDVDLRNPGLARHLLPPNEAPGLVDAIMDPSLTLPDVVASLPHLAFDVLPAGRSTATPYDVVRSPRFGALLAEARGRYGSIILDTPPLIRVPDGRIIERSVDGVLLVVAANRTPRKLVAEGLRLIDPAKLIGIVFNGDTERRPGYDLRVGAPGSGPGGAWPGSLDRLLDTLQRWRR